MAELSEGLDLSNVGTTTREVQGITNTVMHFTGFEVCTPRTRPPTTCSTTGLEGVPWISGLAAAPLPSHRPAVQAV
jgi:hypothetical protein